MGYGGEGRAITAGMNILAASERSDVYRTYRPVMAKVAYGRPEPLQTPFEMTSTATAGPEDEGRPLCVSEGIDPDLFFVDARQAEAVVVQRLCRNCPRRELCLEDGIDQEFGIWGGLTATQRGPLRQARKTKKRKAKTA